MVLDDGSAIPPRVRVGGQRHGLACSRRHPQGRCATRHHHRVVRGGPPARAHPSTHLSKRAWHL